MNYKKRILHQTLLFFLLTVTISFFVTCVSNNKEKLQEQEKYLQYPTVELFFGFTYPSQWYVFEASDGVHISNKVEILTSPPAEQEQQELPPYVFDGTIYFTDVEELKKMHFEYQNVLDSITPVVVEEKEKRKKVEKVQITISHIDNLGIFAEFSDVQEKKRLQILYSDAFFQNISTSVKGAYFSGVLLLVAPKVVEYKSQFMLGLQVTAIHRVEDDVSAGYVGMYNTGIILSSQDIQDSVWKMEKLVNNNVIVEFLQEVINLVYTAKKL